MSVFINEVNGDLTSHSETYGIPPAKMTAAGRGEFVPLMTNDTNEGRAANRRTRIVILPQLDQFFNLLEHKG